MMARKIHAYDETDTLISTVEITDPSVETADVTALFTLAEGDQRRFTLEDEPTDLITFGAPVKVSDPTFGGIVAVGETVTLVDMTTTGAPDPTLATTLTLDGADVSGDIVNGTYLVPDAVGQTLDFSQVASNFFGTLPAASVSRVVADGTGLIDQFPGTFGAWSLRNLSDDTTNVVRVRRDSDNAEQDFTAGEITNGTLVAFTGSANGDVSIWYSQDANARDGVQTTPENQPRLVEAGVLNTLPGLSSVPAMDFNERWFEVPVASGVNFTDYFFGFVVAYGGSNGNYLFAARTGGGTIFGGGGINVTENAFLIDGDPPIASYTSVITGDSNYFISAYTNVTNLRVRIYGTTYEVTPTGKNYNINPDSFFIGGENVDKSLKGFMAEVIVYNTDQTSNVSAIDQNILDYTGIS